MQKSFFILCSAILFSCCVAAQEPDKLSANDKDFIEYAGEFNLEVTRLGVLAQSRSHNPAVKSFGAAIQKDHTAALQKLASIADKDGGVAPQSLDAVHKTSVNKVRDTKASEFDRGFLKAVVNQHEAALDSYKREASGGLDPALQAYAKDALPGLEEHLKKAKEMSSGLP